MALPVLSVLLWGCATPNVYYSDLRPPVAATALTDKITVQLGTDVMNSAHYTRAETEIEGRTILISGYKTLREQTREIVIRPSYYRLQGPVAVAWVNPDGGRVPIPLKTSAAQGL
jgi:hypothetical protein